MTDPVEPDPNQMPPVPPVPPAAPAAPAFSAAPAYAAAPTSGGARTFSLVSFIVGLVSFVFGWTPFFGLIAGVVAVILGIMGARREPFAPKWMWIVGIIAGAVGLLSSLIITILFFIGLAVRAANGY